jgi:hypothetical protein
VITDESQRLREAIRSGQVNGDRPEGRPAYLATVEAVYQLERRAEAEAAAGAGSLSVHVHQLPSG